MVPEPTPEDLVAGRRAQLEAAEAKLATAQKALVDSYQRHGMPARDRTFLADAASKHSERARAARHALEAEQQRAAERDE